MRHFFRSILFISLFLAVTLSPCYAWQGKVVGVTEGDTITVIHNSRRKEIRLYGVDTPEKRQDFGTKAKQFTANMVFGEVAEVTPVTMDRYGRTVSIVYLDGKCLNEELILSGYAWVYKRYCGKAICVKWIDIEQKAKAHKIGLWAKPGPVPPWQFRHSKKSPATKDTEAV